ncbi:MAG TPA: hypothetical protein VLL08_02475 [Kineosporiaceae bacterium]|nr:hypothetical protein [Kineosporiaceae bacterium]
MGNPLKRVFEGGSDTGGDFGEPMIGSGPVGADAEPGRRFLAAGCCGGSPPDGSITARPDRPVFSSPCQGAGADGLFGSRRPRRGCVVPRGGVSIVFRFGTAGRPGGTAGGNPTTGVGGAGTGGSKDVGTGGATGSTGGIGAGGGGVGRAGSGGMASGGSGKGVSLNGSGKDGSGVEMRAGGVSTGCANEGTGGSEGPGGGGSVGPGGGGSDGAGAGGWYCIGWLEYGDCRRLGSKACGAGATSDQGPTADSDSGPGAPNGPGMDDGLGADDRPRSGAEVGLK